jgi:hypothetical protein
MSKNNELSQQLNKLLDMTCTHIKDGINKIAEEDIIGKATQSIEEIINNEPEVKTLLNVVNLFMNKPSSNNKTTTETLLEIRAHLTSQENNENSFITNHIKIIETILECKTADTKTIEETIELTTNVINSNDEEIKELNSKIKKLKEKNKMYKSLNKIYREEIDNQEEDCNE